LSGANSPLRPPMPQPARAFGPMAWPWRGQGIRALGDLVGQLRIVEPRFPREDLAHRLRQVARPFLWDSHFLEPRDVSIALRLMPEKANAQVWYWDERSRTNVESSIAWDAAVATTGYIDIPKHTEPSARIALYPLWLVLGQPKLLVRDPVRGNFVSASLLSSGTPKPPVHSDEQLQVTVLAAGVPGGEAQEHARNGDCPWMESSLKLFNLDSDYQECSQHAGSGEHQGNSCDVEER